MWHWMRVSVRASHRGWKLATRVARLAIGVPDYEGHLPRPRSDHGATAGPRTPLDPAAGPPRTASPTAPPRESDSPRAGLPG